MMSTMFKYLLCLSMVLSLIACHKKKTSWSSNWELPLVLDTLTLDKYINDSTLAVDASNYLEVNLTRTLLDIGIEDLVTLKDTTISQSFNIAASNFTVAPGTSITNQIEEHQINVEDLELKRIQIAKGKIHLKVYNPIETDVIFTIKLPGVKKNNVDFEQQFIAPMGTNAVPGQIETELDISDYTIDLTGAQGSSFNRIQSQMIVVTSPTGPSVTIQNSDVFKVDASFKAIKINYARGYFGQQILSDTLIERIDLFRKITGGTITTPNASVQLEVINGCKVNAQIKLTQIKSENAQGTQVNLSGGAMNQNVPINPAVGAWNNYTPSTQAIEFNSTNSNLNAYLENLGDAHTFGYLFQLNPWGNTSGGWDEIFQTSRIQLKLKAQLPLVVGVDGLQIRDTFDFSFQNKLESSHIEKGTLLIDFTNGFPYSAGFQLEFLNASDQNLFSIVSVGGIESGLAGFYNSTYGIFTQNSHVELTLTESQAQQLGEVHKIVVKGMFNSPNPANNQNQAFPIPEKAFLSMKAKAKITYQTKM